MCGTISRTLKGKTQLSNQIQFYNAMAVPVLMYGSENWSLNRSDERKIEAAEMNIKKIGFNAKNSKREKNSYQLKLNFIR